MELGSWFAAYLTGRHVVWPTAPLAISVCERLSSMTPMASLWQDSKRLPSQETKRLLHRSRRGPETVNKNLVRGSEREDMLREDRGALHCIFIGHIPSTWMGVGAGSWHKNIIIDE